MSKNSVNIFIALLFLGYIVALFKVDAFFGWGTQLFTPKSPSDVQCQQDSDCVRLPVCRPQHCINQNAQDKYETASQSSNKDSWLQYNPGCLRMYYGPHIEERVVESVATGVMDLAADCICRSSVCENPRQFISFWRLGRFIPFGQIILLIPIFIFSSATCRINWGKWKFKAHALGFILSIFVYILYLSAIENIRG